MNEEMIYSAFCGARKAAPEAGDHLGEDAEIDVVAEDGVTPVDDDAERRRQREKERPDQRITNTESPGAASCNPEGWPGYEPSLDCRRVQRACGGFWERWLGRLPRRKIRERCGVVGRRHDLRLLLIDASRHLVLPAVNGVAERSRTSASGTTNLRGLRERPFCAISSD